MGKTHVFARKTGILGTVILETNIKKAIEILRENNDINLQIGILSGANDKSLAKVYGEYAPFKKVSNERELLQWIYENLESTKL